MAILSREYLQGRKQKKMMNDAERLREAKATTMRKVRLVRLCAKGKRTWCEWLRGGRREGEQK